MSTKKPNTNNNFSSTSHNSFNMSNLTNKIKSSNTNSSNFNISNTDTKSNKRAIDITSQSFNNSTTLSSLITNHNNDDSEKKIKVISNAMNTSTSLTPSNYSNVSSSLLGNSAGNVKVMCRFRPISDKEKDHSKNICCEFMDNTQVSIRTTNDLNTYRFSFDRIFNPKSSQQEVFNLAAKPIIDSVLEGFNGTIFAYGQTSSGKTYTMMGDLHKYDDEGIIPRMVKHVFSYISNSTSEVEYIVKLSMMEIYMERVRDLIETTRINLNIREDKAKGIFVEDLSEHYVASEEEVIELIQLGSDNRTTAFTNMNDYSSRSHTILMLTIKSSNVVDLSTKTGKLFLVDLAGSEKISKTGATGLTLEEAKNINSSLTTLGMVINSLTDEKSTHIPYRESKITRILQESLGGNAKTCLIITCSPSSFNDSETLSTLRFGMRAKKIENKPKINKEISAAELKIEVDRLESILNDLESRNSQLEKVILNNGLQLPKQTESLMSNKTRSPRKMVGGSSIHSLNNFNIKVNSSFDDDSKIETEKQPSFNEGHKNSNNQKHNSSKSGVVFNNTRYVDFDPLTNKEYENNNNKILNLIAENKSLSRKLNEAEEEISKYLIELTETQKIMSTFFERRNKLEETEKENISKIEFLERKIKKLRYEQTENNSSSEIYNNSEEPVSKKIEELVKLITENHPSFEYHKVEFTREIDSLIKQFKSRIITETEEEEKENKTHPNYEELEEKYREKIEDLKKEIEKINKSERLKMQQLTNCEKQILTLKEKIDFYEHKNDVSFEEKNYLKKIESLESSLNKVNNMYYQLSIQKSALGLENEVQSKIISMKNEIISKLGKGQDYFKDDEVS